MSLSSITWLTFSATALLVVSLGVLLYDWLFRYRLLLRERVKELSSQGPQETALHLFKDSDLRSFQQDSDRSLSRQVRQLLAEGGCKCTAGELGVMCLGCASACAGLGFWLGPWTALVLLPIGAAAPVTAVFVRRHYRRRKLCRQLPEAFEMISRAVRSGQTVHSALKIIADDFEPPISKEFALCYEEQNLGVSREAALRKLANRTGIMELRIFVVAMLVQAKSGGNLVELLNNLAETIRKRLKLSDRVRALTGEGRMQARVLIVLPIVAWASLFLLSPEYASIALQWPWLLVATAAAQAAGAFWIRKIVTFEY